MHDYPPDIVLSNYVRAWFLNPATTCFTRRIPWQTITRPSVTPTGTASKIVRTLTTTVRNQHWKPKEQRPRSDSNQFHQRKRFKSVCMNLIASHGFCVPVAAVLHSGISMRGVEGLTSLTREASGTKNGQLGLTSCLNEL